MAYPYQLILSWLYLLTCPVWIACAAPETDTSKQIKSMKRLEVGDIMPTFSLIDQDGNVFDSDTYVGKQFLVVYFYPQDDSPGCTKQACAVRDEYESFTDLNTKVVGINSGSVESHKAFQQKYNLPFTLLSDSGNKVSKAFGVRNYLFLTGRETFVVDLEGKIAYTFRGIFKNEEHIAGALDYLQGN